MARPTPKRRTAVSRAQIETIAARAVGLFGLVFAVQTVPTALTQALAMQTGSESALMAVLYGAIVALAVAAVTKVAVRVAAIVFAGLYAIALLVWPLLIVAPGVMHGQAPWLYYLCTVATTAAALALPTWWAAAYTVVVPGVYGAIRLLPAGGAAGGLLATLDAMYAIILGGVALTIITMLRQAAGAVDAAQEAALQRYDLAVRQHATESERVKIDALVHDSVLTTLLSAAAATTPAQEQLAARMARDAIRRLDDVGASGPRALDRVDLRVLVRRLREAVGTFSAGFAVRVIDIGGVELPVEAVDALYAASVQAMVNSLQHAGDGVRRELRVRGVRADGCVIEVADDGVGFDPEYVPIERLGVRVSIVERMADAGGSSRIDAAPGAGTTVTVAWPVGAAEGEA